MHIKEFDYDLPPGLIAQHPAEKRDHSRLMVLNREEKTIEHKSFFKITDFLKEGDVLVLNDTKVIPARLEGKKQSGGKVEVLLLKPLTNGRADESVWRCLVKSSKKPGVSSKIVFDQSLTAEIIEEDNGEYTLAFTCKDTFERVLDRLGKTPLPPYIKRKGDFGEGIVDRERYQTVFARSRGAVAAPTAGLHFTRKLLDHIIGKGVELVYLTLEVGWGTFQPVRVENIEEHRMHAEQFILHTEAARAINEARQRGSRIIGVGTTTTRLLESVAGEGGLVQARKGSTDLFIYPGYSFKAIDCLITNFHVPRSTLIMLVSAFAGREFILDAYRAAIKEKYRFYSYGDAMMII
jgi:S-adenosylmethionine:tRNA ribosyltransferase-isomerase